MDLVTGATGYVGGRLLERLVEEGRAVRAMARDTARLEALDGVEAVRGDVLSGAGLAAALDGCSTAYYLIHSMEAGRENGSFGDRDRRAATNFAEAALRAGVERTVYLGGIVPPPGTPLSPHLASRLEVEEILLRELPASVAFRASIVIGARSSSFRILVRLVERLRVLPFPAWRRNRTQPVDERDAIEYLARAPDVPEAAGRSLDIVGPDVLSYGQMIATIAESMGVGRAPVGLGLTQTPAASAVVSGVTGQPLELVRPLMQSLESDLLPRDQEAERIFSTRPRSFARAVEHALREWEAAEPLRAR
ncbi:MAG TPA: NAD(P)H-binding protein [Thermoleophilaceae bacterium]|jgi:uncharacterized protein YbjT (DUF2867 family)